VQQVLGEANALIKEEKEVQRARATSRDRVVLAKHMTTRNVLETWEKTDSTEDLVD